jgi:hypothetical protein
MIAEDETGVVVGMVLSHAGPRRGRATSTAAVLTRLERAARPPRSGNNWRGAESTSSLGPRFPVRVLVPRHRLTAAVARVPVAPEHPVSAAFYTTGMEHSPTSATAPDRSARRGEQRRVRRGR